MKHQSAAYDLAISASQPESSLLTAIQWPEAIVFSVSILTGRFAEPVGSRNNASVLCTNLCRDRHFVPSYRCTNLTRWFPTTSELDRSPLRLFCKSRQRKRERPTHFQPTPDFNPRLTSISTKLLPSEITDGFKVCGPLVSQSSACALHSPSEVGKVLAVFTSTP